jgi:hypothetical protein
MLALHGKLVITPRTQFLSQSCCRLGREVCSESWVRSSEERYFNANQKFLVENHAIRPNAEHCHDPTPEALHRNAPLTP